MPMREHALQAIMDALTADLVTLSARDVGKARTVYRCPQCDTLLAYRGSDRCTICGAEVKWDA